MLSIDIDLSKKHNNNNKSISTRTAHNTHTRTLLARHLGKHREGNVVVLGEGFDLFGRARLLIAKLIARKRQHLRKRERQQKKIARVNASLSVSRLSFV